ncbi:MAG: AmmeMemoRadiSam system protein B [Clostridia bacterium]|jgi:AmmeMemoRadiSam system protein B|nr:AmmeMemoRadiSam system protein B [Clostridia bacterium]
MRKLLILLACALALVSGCGQAVAGREKTPEPPGTAASAASAPSHSSSFVSLAEFNYCLSRYETERTKAAPPGAENGAAGKIIAGIVPHHLTAGHLTARFMEKLAQENPAVIVLVGPNHYNSGAKIITGVYDWQTPAGLVESDKESVAELAASGRIAIDDAVLDNEHSIGAVAPFIKYYLPEARLVPLIFHHGVSLEEVDAVLQALESCLAGKDYVVLGSVDFSHYLTRREAGEKDKITLQAMRDFNYAALFTMDSSYLDSPASLSMVFRYAEQRGVRDFTVLDNTNSGFILQNEQMETTSYFTLLFSGN